jgi:hypothetical protein
MLWMETADLDFSELWKHTAGLGFSKPYIETKDYHKFP